MDDRKTEVFSSAFPCQYLIITLEQGIEVGLAKAEWDGMHEDPSHIIMSGLMFLCPYCLAWSVWKALRKYRTDEVVWSQVTYVAAGKGEEPLFGFHQFINVKRTCAVFTFLHNASCCIEIHYVFFTSLVEYVNAFLWPKHHTLWMKDHLLDNLIRFIFFFLLPSSGDWEFHSYVSCPSFFVSMKWIWEHLAMVPHLDSQTQTLSCFRFSIFLR